MLPTHDGGVMETIAILSFLAFFIIFVLGFVGLIKPLTKLKMPSILAALGWIFGGFVGMMVAAVISPSSPESGATKIPQASESAAAPTLSAPVPQPAPTPTPPPPPPPPPQHLYSTIDGDDYLYSAGISDDAKNAGQVAGQFIAFRYRGMKEGKIVLSSDGMTLRCDKVCAVITVVDQFGNKQHIEYNPASVAGSAFTDAMNGLLVEHPSKHSK